MESNQRSPGLRARTPRRGEIRSIPFPAKAENLVHLVYTPPPPKFLRIYDNLIISTFYPVTNDSPWRALLIGVQGVRVIEIQVMEQAAPGGGAAVQAHALGQPEGGII